MRRCRWMAGALLSVAAVAAPATTDGGGTRSDRDRERLPGRDFTQGGGMQIDLLRRAAGRRARRPDGTPRRPWHHRRIRAAHVEVGFRLPVTAAARAERGRRRARRDGPASSCRSSSMSACRSAGRSFPSRSSTRAAARPASRRPSTSGQPRIVTPTGCPMPGRIATACPSTPASAVRTTIPTATASPTSKNSAATPTREDATAATSPRARAVIVRRASNSASTWRRCGTKTSD